MNINRLKKNVRQANRIYEKYFILVIMVFFVFGIYTARHSQEFAMTISKGMSQFVDSYSLIAPIVIFITLATAMGKILTTKEMGSFTVYLLKWFAFRRIIASFWAIGATAFLFGLPLFSNNSITMAEAMTDTISSMAVMITTSTYFKAIFLAILLGVSAKFSIRIANLLEKMMWGIEYMGVFMLPLVPMFMFVVGVYIQSLPAHINEQLSLGVASGNYKLSVVHTLGFTINPNSSDGMLFLYLYVSIIIGVVCLIFHLGLVFWTNYKVKRFSIHTYFSEFFPKMYPLLWATSSETLALPLCLHLTKKLAPYINKDVRRFVLSTGNTLDSNGTIINVFILLGLSATVVGYPISVFELVASIPIVFLIGYAIPGIPGELILFANPLMSLLKMPASIAPIFLVLYTGLQIGLPDSFRTAANLMDEYLNAVILNEKYEETVLHV